MKYKPEDYINSGYYGVEDDGVTYHKEKLVKCRTSHKCLGGCDSEIKPGEYALLESGFMDGEPVSCYTCLPCIDKWLDELHAHEHEDEEEESVNA
jgi:hypothetical protein